MKGMFGTFYNQLKNTAEDKKKLILLVDILNRIVIQLLRINCENKIPNQIFCKVLYHMEETLNKKLMGGENLGKFLFKTVNGKWFTLCSNDGTDLNVSSVRAGPWQFAHQLYSADGEIYYCKDIFDRENQKAKKGNWMDYFKTEFYNLWMASNGAATKEQLFEESTWDLYSMCFENNAAAKIGGDLIKEFYDLYKAKIPAVSSMTVERILFVAFVKDQQKSKPKNSDNTFNTLGDLTRFQSARNPSFGNKQSLMTGWTESRARSNQRESRKIEERKSSAKMTIFQNDGEGAGSDPKLEEEEKVILPFKEIIGMFRDFSRVIMPYKLNAFRKVTHFLVGNKVDIQNIGKYNLSQIMDKKQ